jgi:hypothetical protein
MDRDEREQSRRMARKLFNDLAAGVNYGPLPKVQYDLTPLDDEVEALPDDILAGLSAQHTCPKCGHTWEDDDDSIE